MNQRSNRREARWTCIRVPCGARRYLGQAYVEESRTRKRWLSSKLIEAFGLMLPEISLGVRVWPIRKLTQALATVEDLESSPKDKLVPRYYSPIAYAGRRQAAALQCWQKSYEERDGHL